MLAINVLSSSHHGTIWCLKQSFYRIMAFQVTTLLISGRLYSAAIQKINVNDTDTASIDERVRLLATIELSVVCLVASVDCNAIC